MFSKRNVCQVQPFSKRSCWHARHGGAGDMRTVVVGNRKLSRHLLQHLLDQEWNVVGAIVSEGELATEQANYVPFDELVTGTGCELHATSNINSSETRAWLHAIEPDICLCGGWSQIIDKEVLRIPEEAFLGFHSSQLPKGRGGAPVNWSLISGAETVWISLFEYVSAVDAGGVYAQGPVPVEFRDDIETVFDALAAEACRLASTVRSDLADGAVDPEPQSLEDATYRPRRQPQDGLIAWRRSPRELYDWIRAQTKPYPGAYTFYEGQKLSVWQGVPVDRAQNDAVPGEVVQIIDGEGVDVCAGSGLFRLQRVKHGNKPTRWADRFAREEGLLPGDRMGPDHAPTDWHYTGMRRLLGPTPFETNLTVGESGTLEIVSFTGSRKELTTCVKSDGERIFKTEATVDGEYRESVEYRFREPGIHTVSVRFERNGATIDTRYLKVFVTES